TISEGLIITEMENCLKEISNKYDLFEYFGSPDPDFVVVGLAIDTRSCKEEVNRLRRRHKKVGVITVRLVRPWSHSHFLSALPTTVKRVATTTMELFTDVASSFALLPQDSHIELIAPSAPHVLGHDFGVSRFPLDFIPAHDEFSSFP